MAPLDDPTYREAIIDLLAVLAYTELSAFERLAADAALAPTVGDKAELARMAAAELRHFEQLRDRLTELGADSEAAMQPFAQGVDAFHESTRPADWLEGLVKAYVGDGIAADFYREIATHLDEETGDLVMGVCADTGHSAFAVERVRAAIAADPRVAGRLALWGRRLVGEMLSQAQRVAAERDSLVTLIVGGMEPAGRPSFDLAALAQMFARLTENHTLRMQTLGLSA
ncbi:MAG TPA: ferritin-like fold-containing protein [Actinomycetes bacterium]|nr:ferritin-like fold-containing protein [Actinomycetes bacterium]